MLTDPPTPQAAAAGATALPSDTSQFLQALHDFGERWQLEQAGEDGVWIAIERPALRELRVVSAPTLSGLTDKLKTTPPAQA